MLLISPKTYSKTVEKITKFFNAEKRDVPFWHSNFKDYYYFAQVGDVPLHILFTGYGEGTVAHGVTHGYDKFLRHDDTYPAVIYLGACFATTKSEAVIGDVIIPDETFSDSDIVREMKHQSGNVHLTFDAKLTHQLREAAKRVNVPAHGGKIFCKETYHEEFWIPFAKEWGPEQGYEAGEVESAGCLAACNLKQLPCAAIFDVKDKVYEDGYKVAPHELREQSTINMLKIIKELLIMQGE